MSGFPNPIIRVEIYGQSGEVVESFRVSSEGTYLIALERVVSSDYPDAYSYGIVRAEPDPYDDSATTVHNIGNFRKQRENFNARAGR